MKFGFDSGAEGWVHVVDANIGQKAGPLGAMADTVGTEIRRHGASVRWRVSLMHHAPCFVMDCKDCVSNLLLMQPDDGRSAVSCRLRRVHEMQATQQEDNQPRHPGYRAWTLMALVEEEQIVDAWVNEIGNVCPVWLCSVAALAAARARSTRLSGRNRDRAWMQMSRGTSS